jgi:hypothetical protein
VCTERAVPDHGGTAEGTGEAKRLGDRPVVTRTGGGRHHDEVAAKAEHRACNQTVHDAEHGLPRLGPPSEGSGEPDSTNDTSPEGEITQKAFRERLERASTCTSSPSFIARSFAQTTAIFEDAAKAVMEETPSTVAMYLKDGRRRLQPAAEDSRNGLCRT